MTTTHTMPGHADPSATRSPKPASPSGTPRGARQGLYVRFVVRMSGHLGEAIAVAARRDGITAGAWARRILLDHVGLQSPQDARSGRPVRRPDEDQAAIAASVRALAAVSAALAINDEAAAKAGLREARAILIPLAVHRPPA